MSFTMKTRLLVALILLVLLASTAFAYFRFSQQENTVPTLVPETATEQVSSENDEALQVSYMYIATESGQLALDLLRSQTEVETEDYGSAGEFVTSINGLAGNNEYYWAFYLNNEYAEKGAAQTTLQEGDVIRFVYEPLSVMTAPTEVEMLEGETENASAAGETQ